MNVTAIHRSAQLLPRLRRRSGMSISTATATASSLLNAQLRQQLQAAGIATESLVAVRAPTGEWLLLTRDLAENVQAASFDDQAFANAVRAALDDTGATEVACTTVA